MVRTANSAFKDETHTCEKSQKGLRADLVVRAEPVLRSLTIQEPVLPIEKPRALGPNRSAHWVSRTTQDTCAKGIQLRQRRRMRDCFVHKRKRGGLVAEVRRMLGQEVE